MMTARKKAMTGIEALVEALTRFDGAAAARIDWEPLFPDWESPVRRRYVHNTRTIAAGVLCPDKRPGCYQELRENEETDEWRAVCSRDSEECARRTLTRQQATKWSLDVQALCKDIAESLKTGANPYEQATGVWECGKLRLDKKQYAGILFVVGGDGFSERLEYARGIFDGTGIVIPSIEKANNGLLAVSELCGVVMFDIAEHCRIERGRIVANSLEDWAREMSCIHGTGMKAGVWMDTPRGMTVGGQIVTAGIGSPVEPDNEETIVRVIRDGEAIAIGNKTYEFTGSKRWEYVRQIVAGRGGYVQFDKNLKSYFAKNKEAKAFFDLAIAPEGTGRNGTGRYRLKI